jgi:hypothetical protein
MPQMSLIEGFVPSFLEDTDVQGLLEGHLGHLVGRNVMTMVK